MPRICTRLSRLTVAAALSIGLTNAARAEEFARNAPLSITTFNIKYFGLNGDPESSATESRADAIREHLSRERLFTDVMVFEEIVDVEMLKRDVVGPAYTCRSYDHPNPEHQHVVVCVRGEFVFAPATDDDNYALEDVTLGQARYRPAVHGVVKSRRGQPLLHVFGVHLKAYPEFSNERLQQADIIADYLNQRGDDAPVIILGDFNTYNQDVSELSERFARVDRGLTLVEVPGPYTWRSASSGHKLDHVWISSDLTAGDARIAGPCATTHRDTIASYLRSVSDHCPVTLTVTRSSMTR